MTSIADQFCRIDAAPDSPRRTRTDFHITVSPPLVEHVYDNITRATDFDCYSTQELAEFDNAERWFVGVRVAVRIYAWQGGTATIHEIRSAGCWGVDSDGTTVDYHRDLAAEEARSLIPLLERLAPEGFDAVEFIAAARAETPMEV